MAITVRSRTLGVNGFFPGSPSGKSIALEVGGGPAATAAGAGPAVACGGFALPWADGAPSPGAGGAGRAGPPPDDLGFFLAIEIPP